MKENVLKNTIRAPRGGDYKRGANREPSEVKAKTKAGNKVSKGGENNKQEKLFLRAKRARQSALRL